MGEVKEVTPISEKEFESHIRNTLNLQYFECTKRFKSVGRAFRRGHITNFGFILPNRPYNNKKHTENKSWFSPGIKSIQKVEKIILKRKDYGRRLQGRK